MVELHGPDESAARTFTMSAVELGEVIGAALGAAGIDRLTREVADLRRGEGMLTAAIGGIERHAAERHTKVVAELARLVPADAAVPGAGEDGADPQWGEAAEPGRGDWSGQDGQMQLHVESDRVDPEEVARLATGGFVGAARRGQSDSEGSAAN